MLKSLIYKKYLGYDEKTKLCSYLLNLEDDQLCTFEIVGSVIRAATTSSASMRAVIKFYSERNFSKSDIVSNLFIGLQLNMLRYNWNISDQIRWGNQYLPEFKSYQEEIGKLLLLC